MAPSGRPLGADPAQGRVDTVGPHGSGSIEVGGDSPQLDHIAWRENGIERIPGPASGIARQPEPSGDIVTTRFLEPLGGAFESARDRQGHERRSAFRQDHDQASDAKQLGTGWLSRPVPLLARLRCADRLSSGKRIRAASPECSETRRSPYAPGRPTYPDRGLSRIGRPRMSIGAGLGPPIGVQKGPP